MAALQVMARGIALHWLLLWLARDGCLHTMPGGAHGALLLILIATGGWADAATGLPHTRLTVFPLFGRPKDAVGLMRLVSFKRRFVQIAPLLQSGALIAAYHALHSLLSSKHSSVLRLALALPLLLL